ncbi:Cof-type HAD-IIB family hydrolase [Staphylococcus durrellii]|uniref:Cof-type HAD-IIB family hydrolase n=1 Tax=Staphylococcus durrellii TaxID=2781773 RepID=UPI00189DD455|nr:Cof-type HAD-IIB family hydrolase [Staphylococcus durrellii]MBF7016239.1 HAD family hydrolase [Staphylococcus durrellii]
MIKAIAVDMDGTFLDSNKNYDERRFNHIFKQLQQQGVKFIAASGNQYAKLVSIFGERDMYFIAENGSVIYNGSELYDYKAFDYDVYKKLIDYIHKERGMSDIIICGLQSAYILKNTSDDFKKNAHFYYRQLQEVDSFDMLPQDEFVKVAFNINRQTHPDLDDELLKKFHNDIGLVSSGRDSVDIIIPNMTKGNALKRLLDKWGLLPSQLMAFGDANNDYDMLELAEYSYVMQNSEDQALFDVANHIAPSNDNQGVLSVIEEQVHIND